ncbi:Heat shock factor protein 4 [Paramecium bursaria]
MIIKKIQRKKRSGNFLQKTKQILDSKQYVDIIDWLPDGNGFMIHDQKRFKELILPQYFSHSNYQSFLRSINNYGFKKVSANKQTIFSNPDFKPNWLIEQLNLTEINKNKNALIQDYIISNHELKSQLVNSQIFQAQAQDQMFKAQQQFNKTINDMIYIKKELQNVYSSRVKHMLKLTKVIMKFYSGIKPGPFREIFEEMFQFLYFLRQKCQRLIQKHQFQSIDYEQESEESFISLNPFQYLKESSQLQEQFEGM